ncbi:organic cation transporter protein-like [Schistocerca gregaria]|uniref:organic cation transporter protein-like n=1 Tax=Schistocerca gregaria TaxID=7010 RepID=UPI00211DCE15|nr:organic cation transporter protein-like [Schistocerca gregaria]
MIHLTGTDGRARSHSGRNTGDPVQLCVGEWGRWQWRNAVLLSLLKMPVAWYQLSILVLEAPSPFWCAGHPPTQESYDACVVPRNSSTWNDSSSLEPCSSWEYAPDIFTSTIVTEWDLVCSRKHLADVTQFTFMLGVLLGTVVAGAAADRWGRKKPLMFCIGLQVLASTAAALAPWLALFILCRFILATATGGILVIGFVLAMEISGDRHRTTVSVLYQLPFTVGLCIMAAAAYMLRDWRHFHLSLSALSALFLSYAWLVPESPRWLLAVGRRESAVRVLSRGAKLNRLDAAAVRERLPAVIQKREEQPRPGITALFRSASLRRRMCVLCQAWFVSGLTFFSFTQSLDRMGSNIFFNITMAGVVGIPGTILCVFVIRLGRKRSVMIGQIILIMCCLLITAFPKGSYAYDWPRLSLSGVAITSMSVSFTTVYLYSGELLPTVVRNAGLGFAAMFSRLGSAIAPFVKSMDAYWVHLPMLIIGCAALITTVGISFLPETKGQPLLDTFEEDDRRNKEEVEDQKSYTYKIVNQQDQKTVTSNC